MNETDWDQKLLDATHCAQVNGVREAINNGANINVTNKSSGDTPLINSCWNSRTENVMMLLKMNADPDIQNAYGTTALTMSVTRNQPAIIKLLIEEEANLNLQNQKGSTALNLAAEHNNMEILEMLVDAGADLNIKDNDGNTPLINSASKIDRQNLIKLVNAGADINAQNNAGSTALINASWNCRVLSVMELIKAGADINIKNKHGDTALSLATPYSDANNRDISEILIKAGASIDCLSDSEKEKYADAIKAGRDKRKGIESIPHAVIKSKISAMGHYARQRSKRLNR